MSVIAPGKMGWGIAGCGWVARDYVGPAIEASANGRLVAVFDPHEGARTAASLRFGVPSTGDLAAFSRHAGARRRLCGRAEPRPPCAGGGCGGSGQARAVREADGDQPGRRRGDGGGLRPRRCAVCDRIRPAVPRCPSGPRRPRAQRTNGHGHGHPHRLCLLARHRMGRGRGISKRGRRRELAHRSRAGPGVARCSTWRRTGSTCRPCCWASR